MTCMNLRGFDCYYDYQQVSTEAPTVIFLNGIMSGIESWSTTAQTAQALGYNTLCYEYRGQWRSHMTPGPYSMQDHRDDLQALMAVLAIDRAHLVGTSYGGMVAMPFAADHPERVQSLVLIATAAAIRPPSYAIVKAWRELAAEGDIDRLFLGMVPHLFSPRTLRENPDLASRRLAGLKKALRELPDFCKGQVLLHDAHFQEMLGDGVTAQLAGIACKTLVVSGEQDLLYPPADSSHIARNIAGAEHVIVADGGHAVVAERGALINTLVAGHLATSA